MMMRSSTLALVLMACRASYPHGPYLVDTATVGVTATLELTPGCPGIETLQAEIERLRDTKTEGRPT